MKRSKLQNIALTALFLAVGLVLPILTGQIPQIGKMLLPMHLPVFLCALICGWKYAVPMAFVLPLLRSVTFGMPVLIPEAAAMAPELATYALVAGLLYALFKKQYNKRKYVTIIGTMYVSIISAMIAGRVVFGIAKAIILGINGKSYTFAAFITGTVVQAIPGIILQLALIPAIMILLDRTHLVPFREAN